MPDPTLLGVFVFSCVILALIPGPNVALIVSNSIAYGQRYGLMTVAGTCCAIIPQLLLTTLGMTAVLSEMANGFTWLRWAGAIYLIGLGVSHWRAPAVDLTRTTPQPRSAKQLLLRAFLVSISNPKTLLFYSAFFPQFIDPNRPQASQFVWLSVTCLLVILAVDSLWALLAAKLRWLLAMHGTIRNRLTGGLLIGAGLGLAAARRT